MPNQDGDVRLSQAETVDRTLSDLGVSGVPFVRVFNKVDLVQDPLTVQAAASGTLEATVCVAARHGLVQPLVDKLAGLSRPA